MWPWKLRGRPQTLIICQRTALASLRGGEHFLLCKPRLLKTSHSCQTPSLHHSLVLFRQFWDRTCFNKSKTHLIPWWTWQKWISLEINLQPKILTRSRQHGFPGENSVCAGHETHSLFRLGELLPTSRKPYYGGRHRYAGCSDCPHYRLVRNRLIDVLNARSLRTLWQILPRCLQVEFPEWGPVHWLGTTRDALACWNT